MIQFTFLPDTRWLVLFAVGALAVVATSYAWAHGRAGRSVRTALAVVRLAILGLVVLFLLDPNRVERIEHRPKSRVAVLVDTSRSMGTQDVPGGRLGVGRDWLQRNLLASKPAETEVELLRFDRGLGAVPDLRAVGATGSVTALAGALESLLQAPARDPWTSVVLVSDGIDTTLQNPESVARQFRRRGIPIHTVTTGTTNDVQDIVVESVQVRRAVPNESPTRVTMTVRSKGYAGRDALVEIRHDRDVVATRQIRLTGASQSVEVEFTPRQRGFQIYEIGIAPQKDEWLASNNRRKFGLEVTDPTLRVVYMEGTPQQDSSPIPEWKYLKDALQSDTNIQVTVLYRQVGNNGQYLNTVDADPETGDRIYPVEHPTRGFPRTLERLLNYDVVIHSDIRISSFSADQMAAIAQLVEQHGGGFVMIGGNSAFGKGGYHRTVLDRIIPVAMENGEDSEARPIQLKVSPNAWGHPLIAFNDDPADTRRIWTEKFPTLYGMNRVERAKPGAVVLAKADDGNVLMAVQEIGRGRTMAFTSDTTRSWGRDFETSWGEASSQGRGSTGEGSDSRYYRRFWVNAVRWLAAGRMGKTNSAVTLELARGYAGPGEEVQAVVKVRDDRHQEIPTADVLLQFAGAAPTNAPISARYDGSLHAYVASVRVPREGSHVVVAAAYVNRTKLGEDRQLLVGETSDREQEDLRARPEVMAGIASVSGGRAFSASAIVPSPGSVFGKPPPGSVEFRRRSLWDRAVWLGAVLGLLTVEWSVRRWRGLA